MVIELYEKIKDDAKVILATDSRNEKAKEELKNAKLSYEESCLTDAISKVRTEAANIILNKINEMINILT
ncbi:Uncharacterised protein [uncultured Clostridium sp.]|uniref:hypothetical protein n=1 Tax=uncultured Clostridium sp. TaxID=59620 RepID=UPI0008225F54|nr:hypothetical protein [uncultured Clostridium sp.]SCJ63353.1 Uncharacterised protein [uncultured Clostridium sp.]